MKKIILASLAILFTGSMAFADGGKTKHKNAGKEIKKEAKAKTKKNCPNRPGCICN